MVETYYICNKIASHWPNVWKKVKINYIDRSISQVYVQLQLQSKQFILELSNNGKVGSITGSISSTFYWSIHEVTLEPSWLSLENLIISASNYILLPSLSIKCPPAYQYLVSMPQCALKRAKYCCITGGLAQRWHWATKNVLLCKKISYITLNFSKKKEH